MTSCILEWTSRHVLKTFLKHATHHIIYCPLRLYTLSSSSNASSSSTNTALVHIIAGIPGLTNPTALGALFSLTATGLYTSYLIPILLRVTVSRESFQPAEFSLGKYSVPMGIISVTWASFMIITLCLPQDAPITVNNMNYSPIALGIVLISAFLSWIVSARYWFKGAHRTVPYSTWLTYSPPDCNAVVYNRPLHLPYGPSSFIHLNCFLHCQE
jgi:Amino acid permease